MKKATGNAGAQPQPASIGGINDITVTPIVQSSVDKQPVAISAGTSNEKLEPEVESAQELVETGQKLHLPLILTLAGAAFLNTLAVQSTVIILPSIGRELDIPAERQEWIISAYYLSFGCFLLLFGRFADIFGRRSVFLIGSAWLTVITIVIPFAPNEIVLDLFRGLQGLGAAANVPTAIGILGATFQPGKYKNYAFALYSAGSSCGSVLGNIFSGVVAQYVSWKWIFWVSAILCGIVTVAGHLLIPNPKVEASSFSDLWANVDWVGGTLVTVAIILLNFALTEGNVVGWSTFWVPTLLVLSIVLLVLFALWVWYLERKGGRPPLLRISIFRNSRFNAAQVIMATVFAAFNNYLVYVTYFYQDYIGLGPLDTAIRFIPTGIMGFVGNIIAAKLLSRVPGYYLLVFSCSCVGISCLLMAVPIPPSTSYWAYSFIAMLLSTLGADIVHPTLNLYTVQCLPLEDQALGAAVITAVLQVGRSIGITLATVVEVSVEERAISHRGAEGDLAALLQGLRASQWFNFSLAVAACIVALLFFRSKEKVGAIRQ